ncbi:MAG: thioredoxin fold domain-containing protein [Gammaproteobacteria bacterium]
MLVTKHISLPLLLFVIVLQIVNFEASFAQDTEQSAMGKFLGAKETTHPDWFKESFLDFEEDIAEAADQGKRLILYFHQDGCPYCNKLVEDNFSDPDIGKKVQELFDLVAINMWGDREVVQVGGKDFTEKTLAAALNVNFTPTLLFFAENKKVALRLDGYYPPVEFNHALDYVSARMETQQTFSEYLASYTQQTGSGTLNSEEWFLNPPYDLTQFENKKPIAVMFEEPDCDPCDLLHQKTLRDPAAPALLEQFNIIQLNRWADTEIVKPDGMRTTAAKWAMDLGLGFSPSIVFFDATGQRIITIDAMFKTFHILGVFDYVASSAYLEEPSFQRFLTERAEHIRSTGEDVDIWKY